MHFSSLRQRIIFNWGGFCSYASEGQQTISVPFPLTAFLSSTLHGERPIVGTNVAMVYV